MNKTVSNTIAKFLRRATLALVCGVFAVSATLRAKWRRIGRKQRAVLSVAAFG